MNADVTGRVQREGMVQTAASYVIVKTQKVVMRLTGLAYVLQVLIDGSSSFDKMLEICNTVLCSPSKHKFYLNFGLGPVTI